MLKILLVKTSSLGDVVHNLPVVSDIQSHFAETVIDWVVEEDFADLPSLHPCIHRVIPVAIRRWRKAFFARATRQQIKAFRQTLQQERYDWIIDTQGLLKSAWITRQAKGLKCGFDWKSAKERWASFFYNRTFAVPKTQHAITRNRMLVANALNYIPAPTPHFGIIAPTVSFPWLTNAPYVVLLHATSRADKQWPLAHWIAIGRLLASYSLNIVLPWGNEQEGTRSQELAEHIPHSVVPPKLDLKSIACLLANSQLVIGVDTGLTHLAAALNRPVIALYSGSDPTLTGVYPSDAVVNLGGLGMSVPVAAVQREIAKRLPHVEAQPSL